MRVEAIPAAGAEAMAFKALVHLARGQIKANWAHQGLHVYFGRERHVATRSVSSAVPFPYAVAGAKHRPVVKKTQSHQESRLEEVSPVLVCPERARLAPLTDPLTD